MPALKTLLIYAAAAATSALALPAPQGDGTASIANRDVIGVPVPCGCWDHCTLYKLTDPTVDCPIAPDNSCIALLTCETMGQSTALTRRGGTVSGSISCTPDGKCTYSATGTYTF